MEYAALLLADPASTARLLGTPQAVQAMGLAPDAEDTATAAHPPPPHR
ncbi:hypothetical protein [Corallococcus macrosporus]|uniref:Uncharacterized protein n=1 Tax=Myxococcus fulvus (strain ATCC BAA-855 / HW-1) TaxID=483219 RepID=F8CE76_MYXFH|nr:hypothetical protein [Corallococcus macrosporus]AEI63537.1 hypothetical protein LILAB_08130 [Corallococcus macrosporus]